MSHLKRKAAVWGRIGCLAGMAAWLIFCFMNSQNAAYSIVKTVLLFLTLVMGYRYGPGGGAICGTVCGMILAFWSRDMINAGILAMAGMMAGAFYSLGKLACIAAYLTVAEGIALLYSPNFVRSSGIEFLIAAVLFFIIPVSFLIQDHKKQTALTIAPSASDMDGSIAIRLREMEEAFIEMGKMFSAIYDSREPAVTEQEIRWKNKYMESRAITAEQMLELAELMHTFLEELQHTLDVTKDAEESVSKQLMEKQILTQRIVMTQNEAKRNELLLTLSAQNGVVVSVREIAEIVSEALGRKLKPALNMLGVVSSSVRTIRLEEIPRFQVLYGMAHTVKQDSEHSGDSFSFMELPKGKVLLSLCDGMGSGKQAFLESSKAIELTEQLLEAGFHPQTVLRLVNSVFVMQEDIHPLAMDVAVIDLYNGLCDFTKSGAAVTLIRHGEKIEIVQSETLPIGAVSQSLPMESLYRLRSGDFIIMMTDGVLEAMPGVEKEQQLIDFCKEKQGINPKEIAEQILAFAKEKEEYAKDDKTVLAVGIWER